MGLQLSPPFIHLWKPDIVLHLIVEADSPHHRLFPINSCKKSFSSYFKAARPHGRLQGGSRHPPSTVFATVSDAFGLLGARDERVVLEEEDPELVENALHFLYFGDCR